MLTVPLFVTAPGLVIVMLAIAMALAPPKAAPAAVMLSVPVKVTDPELFVIPAVVTNVAQAPVKEPPFNVINPVKVLLLVLAATESVPEVMVVVPVTVKAVAAVLVVVKLPPAKRQVAANTHGVGALGKCAAVYSNVARNS